MFTALFAGLLASAAATAPLHVGEETIENSYLVVFKDETTAAQRDAHLSMLSTSLAASSVSVGKSYDMEGFHAYHATVTDTTGLDAIRADDSVVDFVEADQVMRVTMPVQKHQVVLFPNETTNACQTQSEATWGLVRTSERELNINGLYYYDDTNLGSGVHAYILDTGIYREHIEFEDRAVFGYSSIPLEKEDYDGNGHGTHVAGTVGSTQFGIAKKVTLVAVKVLSASGSGSTNGVVDGITWTCNDHKSKGNKCVSNLSLGGGFSDAMNKAMDALVDCGCSTAVASGNEGRDACMSSPASAAKAYAVNAMDSEDKASYFTNYGKCTQLWAPGSGITSTWIGSPVAINTISGTSMASPHVCGVMAKHAELDANPASVVDDLNRDATMGVIKNMPGSPNDTPNALLHSTCHA